MSIEQAVYEIIQKASYQERLWAIEEIIQSLKIAPTPDNKPAITHKRLNRFPNAMTMSDDFDEYLGDDFWLGKNYDV